ncbi:hypothetical protein FACS1894176_08940 [Bacteroidia bacterium]|nr:hypothetical protein FACS1894176_08940 [Bacteroidia bacterium]
MTKEDKQRVIGKVVAINSNRFSVELLSGLENFNVSGFDDIHYFAQLNSYVIVPYQNYYLVSEVSEVREKDLNVPFSNPKEQILSKIQTGKFLEVIPIGTINNKNFDFGVSVYPTLYSDVLYIKEEELDIIFKTNKTVEKNCQNADECKKENCQCKNRYVSLPIGRASIFPDYDVKIDIDKFFGSHSAVLGNTGSGKSCTIASMLQTLYKYTDYSATGSTFIFFDVNGEYRQAFSKLSDHNNNIEVKNFTIDDISETDNGQTKKFVLPHWFLNIDEWALLLQASERTQLPILRNALGFTQNLSQEALQHIYACSIMYVFEHWESPVAKRQRIISLLESAQFNPSIDFSKYNAQYGNFPNGEEGKFKNAVRKFIKEDITIDPIYNAEKFNFEDLGKALETAILYEEYHGNKQIRDYCSSLLTRYKSVQNRPDFRFLTQNTEEINQSDYLMQFLGISDNKKKSQIIIIDLNSANDEMVEVVSCVLSRMVFDKLRRAKDRNKFPVNLVLEEAHRYISTDSGKVFGDANKIFERIAKEGRKYGMFLLISSQRPSELSKTVLSQCSNFIVHRIQNPEDLSHIRQITPHISETILKRLPSIPTQHALIFGHAVNLPTTFKVNTADPKPKSDNNEISKNWFREKDFKVDVFAEIRDNKNLNVTAKEEDNNENVPF